MNLMTRRAQFKFSVEVVVELQQLTGKWSAKYRYGPDSSGETGWMMMGTQHSTAAEAADAVLARVSALFPEVADSWLSGARAGLSAD
jgi:hypothetical protein